MENEVTTTEQVAEEVQETTQEETPAIVPEVVPEETQSEEIEIPKPKKQSFQERINEVTKKRRDAEREVERLRQELERKGQPAQPQGRPQLENFATQEEYEDAVYDWRSRAEQARQQEIARKREDETLLTDFEKKSAKYKEVYEDFDEVIQTFPSTPTMVKSIARSDEGGLIAYYLGTNHDVAYKISQLSPESQSYELGKLEAKLILAQKQKKPTGAPAPISPVGATGGQNIDESKLSDDEWFKLEQQRNKEKLKKKYGG